MPEREPVRVTIPAGTQGQSNDRISSIIEKAPREFEVGIGGDFSLLVEEISIRGPESIPGTARPVFGRAGAFLRNHHNSPFGCSGSRGHH